MTSPMRPMSLGEILDRTIQIYRAKFLVFAGIAALPALATIALRLAGYLWERLGPQATVPAGFSALLQEWGSWLTIWQLESIAYCLCWPAIAYVASRAFLGEEPTFLSALYWCMARWPSWLAMAALLWAAWSLLPGLLYRTLLSRELTASWSAALFGYSSWAVSAFIFVARWLVDSLPSVALSPGVAAWTLEGLPVRAALRRGWTLAEGSRFRVFAAWSLATGLRWILYLGLSSFAFLILRFAEQISSRWNWYYMSYRAIFSLSVQGAFILVAPLYPIAVTLIYYDQRIRLEGYDIERMMEAAGMNAPMTPHGGDGPLAPAEGGEAQN